jgi:CRISPR-associated endonuclease Cas1/CRISPR-associated protein Cas4
VQSEQLLSIKNVAEFAYCPRLFYLVQVENQSISNADIERGKDFHSQVDKPTEILVDTDFTSNNKPLNVTSLTLSSEKLGIIGVLDLVEFDGNKAKPVEYKKGSPKKIFQDAELNVDSKSSPLFQPWPVDLVQVGLQIILLEEAGYKVTEAALYYGKEDLKLTIPADNDIKTNALNILNEAKKYLNGLRPPPLINDSRCEKCSLCSICLPYEVNYQEFSENNQEPKKFWPPTDEGIHVVSQLEGSKISVKGNELIFTDSKGAVISIIPLINVESVSIIGFVQISTQAIHVLSEKQIPIAFLSSAGRFISNINSHTSVSSLVRRSQVRIFDNPEKCLELAKALIYAKILNQRTMLMRNHKYLSGNISEKLREIANTTIKSTTLDVLRGYEGYASSIYFRYLPEIFHGPIAQQFANNGRKRRPPPDPINSCLSFAYSMLAKECVSALQVASLEPTIGALHVSVPGRPALALDLMEPFRPLISDSIVITCFNKAKLAEEHFIKTSNGFNFKKSGLNIFFNTLNKRMKSEISHHIFNYKLSYRRMLVLHAKMIAAWLVGDIKELSFLITR